MGALSKSQKEALKWLQEHSGDGVFALNGTFLAAGEIAPHTRGTWNKLRDAGYVEFYKPTGKGRGRMRLSGKA